MARELFEPVYREIFPFWDRITDADRDYICQNSQALHYPKGTNIHDGNECSGVILVRSGSLRSTMEILCRNEVYFHEAHFVASAQTL